MCHTFRLEREREREREREKDPGNEVVKTFVYVTFLNLKLSCPAVYHGVGKRQIKERIVDSSNDTGDTTINTK